MKRYFGLLALASALLSAAQASIVDFDNDPGAGYRFFFAGGANRIVLDDVNRTTAQPIKQVNVRFFNRNVTPVDVTLYVYAATGGAGTAVGALLYTASITGVPNGLSQLSFPGSPATAGFQNLWIGVAASAADAGMVLSPNPNPSIGTSADVFAWDRNGNGVIDTNEYFFFNANPVANFAIQTLVPEPASLIALGAGLAGLVGLRRRKK